MLELNSTFWFGGALDGEREVFVTPGLVLGSFRCRSGCIWPGHRGAARRLAVSPLRSPLDCVHTLAVL